MFSKTLRASLLSLSLLGMSAAAIAAPPGMDGPPPRERAGIEQLVADLDLTPEQAAQFADLKEDMREHRSERKERRAGPGEMMARVMSDPSVDIKAIEAEIDAEAAARAADAKEFAARLVEIRDSLSPEQQALISERLEERRVKMEQMRSEKADTAPRRRGR